MSLPHSSDCPNSPIAIDTPNRRRRSSQTPSPRKTRKRKLRQSTIYKCFHALSRIRNTNAKRGLRRHTTRFTTQPNARRAQSAKVRLRHRLPATTRNHRPIARQSKASSNTTSLNNTPMPSSCAEKPTNSKLGNAYTAIPNPSYSHL